MNALLIQASWKRMLMLSCLALATLTGWAADQTLQAESLTLSGPYAGTISSPFSGVALYANNDAATGTGTFSTIPGDYLIEVRGASNTNSADASVSVLIGGNTVGLVTFSGTTPSTASLTVTLTSGGANQSIELLLTTDDGSSDTYIDWVGITYQGQPAPPAPAPTLPAQGAFYTDVYRNMFVEAGYSQAQVDAKMNQMWDQYFVNGNSATERLYYEVGSDMAYILDTGNDDIRSEGMSYGMMICVQLDKKAEFDKLWKFAKTYTQHAPGTTREGLFAWQVNKSNYSMIDQNSAPDGEEYYVTALMFADARWGSTTSGGAFDPVSDVYDYRGQANYILDEMLDKPAPSTGSCPTGLVDQTEKQIVFGICGSSASFTDPSYHLAGFYDIWALYADNNNQLWTDMANTSRTYLLPAAAHPTTGLMPDYSEFDGTPKNIGSHGNFEYDAWRNIMNMGFDVNWFQKDMSSLVPLIDRQIDFFKDKPNYASLWTLDGTFTPSPGQHSPGLVACNAVGALALEDAKVWPFIDEFFNTSIPSGQYRYYDGLLFMMSYMHLSANFRVWKPGATPPPPSGCDDPIVSVSKTDESAYQANDGSITFTFNNDPNETTIEFSTDGGTSYPTSVPDNSGSVTVNNLAPGTYALRARWGDGDCVVNLGNATIGAASPPASNQSPYTAMAIPGTIQAEDYDLGGSGEAYQDNTAGNTGGAYRNDGVDIEPCGDAGGGFNVGWIANGEWLEYTVGTVAAGTYDIELRVASNSGANKSLVVSLNGNSLGSVNVPKTSGWQSYTTLTISNVALAGGSNQILRLDFVNGSFNVNFVKFIATSSGGGGSSGTQIEAENNVANYYNLQSSNGVVNNISYAHWMRFDQVDISGGTFTYRYSKGNNDNGYMKVRIDQNNDNGNIATIYPPSTGSWSNFNEETVNISGSGLHTVYLYFHNAFENIQLDWIRFGGSSRPSHSQHGNAASMTAFVEGGSGDLVLILSGMNDLPQITVRDMQGREVHRSQADQVSGTRIRGLAPGIYAVSVEEGNQRLLQKVFVR
ncbi:glycosyl hydrolase family 8 [Pontibacter sp. G13]|uniref:glycosyl hydrolase family 8 n=1 Tax=Pontibacter sp. G13 TaxID=3074898 RepID=UPI00288B170F|nr:glycosyl hydrolase family 8 [Pontibacter sp. G13]WNJ20062.1 glycosyl hydrolase family 8 [Pontibacter sp. G13]